METPAPLNGDPYGNKWRLHPKRRPPTLNLYQPPFFVSSKIPPCLPELSITLTVQSPLAAASRAGAINTPVSGSYAFFINLLIWQLAVRRIAKEAFTLPALF